MRKFRVTDDLLRAKLCEHLLNAGFGVLDDGEFVQIEEKTFNYLSLSEVLSKDGKFTEFYYKSVPQEIDLPLGHEKLKNISAVICDKSKEDKDFFEFVGRLLLFCNTSDLNIAFREVINPQFRKRFANVTIHFLSYNDIFLTREASMRFMMTIGRLPEVLDVKNRDQFQGFASMRSLQSPTASGMIEAYLNLILLIFEPVAYGIVCKRLNGSFIFLFGERYPFHDFIPPTFSYHYYMTTFLKTYQGPPHKERQLHIATNWDAATFKTLLYAYVTNLDRLLVYLLDLTHFLDRNNEVNALKAFTCYYSMNRIAAETTTISADYLQQIVRSSLSYAVLDKLANLVKQLRPDLQLSEDEIFKKLLTVSFISQFYVLFDNYPAPFANYFRNRLKESFKDLYDKIRESIFVPGRLNGDEVLVQEESHIIRIKFDDYCGQVIRALRNTSHGYGIREKSLERLIISDCSIGNSIEFIVPLLVLMVLGNIESFLKKW